MGHIFYMSLINEHYVLIIFDVLGENKQNFRQLDLNVFLGSLQKSVKFFSLEVGESEST